MQNRELGRTTPSEVGALVFRPDATVGQVLPKEVVARLSGRYVALSGTLAIDGRARAFVLAEDAGTSRLLVFPQGTEKPRVTEIYVTVAPARDHKADLLFVGADDASASVAAYERATQADERTLAPETLTLLRTATSLETVPTQTFEAAIEALAKQPDWQRLVDIEIEELQDDPLSNQNNRCLLLQELIEAHLREIRIDLDPLIATVAAPIATNQQKAGQALAAASKRPELFQGKEKRAVRALIPLLASQRGRVVRPALDALAHLTGKDLGRDPVAWAGFFKAHFGEEVPLKGTVYELLTFLRFTSGKDGKFLFAVSDDPAPATPTLGPQELKTLLQTFSERAGRLGLAPRVVVFSDEAAARSSDTPVVGVQEVLALLREVGVAQFTTFAPESDTFYPPYRPGFP